jgi:hypothetical protein
MTFWESILSCSLGMMFSPVADAGSPLKNTPVKRDTRQVRGRDHRVVELGRERIELQLVCHRIFNRPEAAKGPAS